ncbi:MAG TPA: hypothetical protein VIR01_20805 [Pyrinomonadaceae bacterium]
MHSPHGETMPPVDPNVQKVQLEIADLRWKVGRTYKIGQLISVISALAAIFALVVSLRQFNDQQEREVKRPIREKQLTLVFELSDVASRIATLKPDDVERKKAESRFKELYWGPIVYVEDRELQQWIGDFYNCLDDYDRAQKLGDEVGSDPKSVGCTTPEQQENRLQKLSLDLAVMRRSKLGLEWDIKFEDIYNARAQKTPTPFALP